MAVLPALILTACGGAHVTEHAGVRCTPAFPIPAQFHEVASVEDPVADRVGIRRSYEDDHGRGLHVSAGIVGEFGEGAPRVAEVRLTNGVTARLYGTTTTWVLVWDEGGTCGVRSVTGSGMTREAFVGMLRGSGLM